tara:strand:- start:1269 stop:2996 length:1728 start_codon:yes stop_codon:yes gene_type:complete
MSKGGGGGGVQESVVTQTNLPEYAEPFFRELLGRTVYESTRPYEAFPGQRIAEFDPLEQYGMQGMAEMAAAGTPQQITDASNIAANVGFQSVGSGMDIARGFRPQMQYSGYRAGDIDSGYDAGFLGQGYQAGQRDAGYQAGIFDPMYQARERMSGFDVGPLETAYQAGSFDPMYQARGIESQYTGQDAGTIADPAILESYMSPYQQLVTDIEKREAQRQSDIQAADISQTAAQAGGLGGYREAIMQAERERNLGQQLADIQTRGSQAAFEQAQRAFEADRAARLQAAQQAEQFRQAAFQTSEQARQRAAEMGMTAQQQEDAARQAEEQFRQAAFGQTADVAAQREQFQQQAFQAGEQARQRAAELGLNAQQMEDAARQAQERFAQDVFAQNEQLRLAQQQEDRAVFQAQEAARQEAARLGLNAQEMQERINQAENEARMRARAENAQLAETQARLGLAGLEADRATRGQQLDASRLLGQLGTDEQRMAFERLRNLQAAGEIRRTAQQRGLDLGYQDFLRQQAFPREQLAFFSQMLQGLPVTPGTTTATFGGPSDAQQLLGAGISGVGLYNALRGG